MTEDQFKNELWIRCYKDQIDGYPVGDPSRTNFEPIVPIIGAVQGPSNREKTLDLSEYADKFTAAERYLLLKAD